MFVILEYLIYYLNGIVFFPNEMFISRCQTCIAICILIKNYITGMSLVKTVHIYEVDPLIVRSQF